MAKDKVFSKRTQSLSDADAYQAYLDDQERRKKEAEQGKVRYVEAAQASRPQYTLPQYQGKSEKQGSKTYNWERELLYNTKVKGAGNSYNKKFDALTKSMGMTEGQASDFRRYLDFQEDSQHVDPKKNKDGSLSKSQSLKYARDARLKNDVIDGILDKSRNIGVSQIQKARQVPFEKVSFWDKVQNTTGLEDLTDAQKNTLMAKDFGLKPHIDGSKDKNPTISKDEWQTYLDTNGIKPEKNKEEPVKKQENTGGGFWNGIAKVMEIIDRPGDAVRTGIKEKAEGRSFLEGAKDGFMGDKNTSGTELNKLIGLDPEKNKNQREISRNINSNLLNTFGLGMAINAFAPDEVKDYAATQTPGAATETVLDPLNLVGGAVTKAPRKGLEIIGNGLGRFVKVEGELPTFTGQASDDVLNSLAPNRQGNYAQSSDDLYNRILNPEAPPKQPSMDDFVPDEIPKVEEPTNILDELLFGQRGNGPKARGSIDQVPMARYAKENISNMADNTLSRVNQADGANQRLLEVQQEMKTAMDSRGIYRKNLTPDELYASVRKEGDPETFDELINLAEVEANKKPVEQDIKSILRNDPKVAEEIRKLNALGGTKPPQEPSLNGNYGQADTQGIDDILKLLGQEENSKIVNNSQVGSADNELLKAVQEEAQVTGQAPEEVIQDLVRTVAKEQPEKLNTLLMNLDGTINRPKAETEAIKPETAPASDVPTEGADKDLLLRLNPQRFNDDAAPTNSMYSYNGKSEPDLVSDHMTTPQKIYKGLVSSNHDLQVVSNKLVKNNATEIRTGYEKRIQAAKDSARPEEAKRLAKEYKYLYKKNGGLKGESALVQAAQNEQTAYTLTEELIQGTYGQAEKALEKAKISLADAWEYQAAKNLDYHMRQGGHADYILSKGWDKGRLVDVINRWKGNEAMEQFGAAINEIRKTRLDYLEKSGLKSSEEFALLNQNEHYIPMSKDKDWSKPAIEANLKKVSSVGSAKPNVMALGKGDEGYFANPVESMMSATYTSIRNALRNDTNGQIAKLAQLDKEGLFIRPTKLPATYEGNVIEHYDNGVVQNYVISPDMAETIKALRSPEKASGVAEKVTGFMGSLKTTSIPYQIRAIPRDWTQAVVNLDGNPLSHVYNLAATVLSPKKSMKEAMKEGGAFHNAFKDGMGAHRTTREMAENFMKANRAKGGKDEIVTPKTAKDKSKAIVQKLWKLNLDYHVGEKLGNFGDTAPRLAAMKQVEKEFTPAMKELEDKIASMDPNDTFELPLLKSELNDLKTQFQREKIFKARDVINYSRRGSSGYAKFFKNYWNFANTATQSVDRYFRQLRKNPISTMAKTMTVAAPMIGAQEAMYRNSSDEDKKIYDDTPDFMKNTMYLFVVNGHRVMFPKPFEVALVTSPIEGLINTTHQYDEESMKKKALDGAVNAMRELVPLDVGDLLTLNFTAPSMAQPAMEVAFNRKAVNKKPISYDDYYADSPVPHFLLQDGKSAKDVASDYTSPAAIKLGDAIGANPDYLAHLIGGYGGDTGKNALAALDALLKPNSEARTNIVTQNMNPFQDFLNVPKGSKLFRETYVDKDKVKK